MQFISYNSDIYACYLIVKTKMISSEFFIIFFIISESEGDNFK